MASNISTKSIVIGSGPAAVACAHQLVSQGEGVLMLDAGIQLEPDHKKILDRLNELSKSDWPRQDVNLLKSKMDTSTTGIPLKYIYGSDFPYQRIDEFIPRKIKQFNAMPSLALGGLSNVWGASMLPYRDEDIQKWPIQIQNLEKHYEAVLKFVDLAATHDDLASLFPLYSDTPAQIRISSQAKQILAHLEGKKVALKEKGFTFGQSRLGLRVHEKNKRSGCVYCGLCMYGCPHELIYNSTSTIKMLKNAQNFKYMGSLFVHKIEEQGEQVTVYSKNIATNQEIQHNAKRIFLGCGPISTTRLLLESLGTYDVPVSFLDSQYFLLPCLLKKPVKDAAKEDLHTLAQIFIELQNRKISERLIHLQVYTYNELYRETLKKLFGPFFNLFPYCSDKVLSKLVIIQGYLHSDGSRKTTVKLKRSNDKNFSTLYLTGESNPETQKIVKRLVDLLKANVSLTAMEPLSFMLNIADNGRGFHFGGSFPMTFNPTGFQSDRLGRPVGFSRVHAIDSTVFPSIPASTITLTVMANAHRIATESKNLRE